MKEQQRPSLRPQKPFPRLSKLSEDSQGNFSELWGSFKESPKTYYKPEYDIYSYESWRENSTNFWWYQIEKGNDPGYPPWLKKLKIAKKFKKIRKPKTTKNHDEDPENIKDTIETQDQDQNQKQDHVEEDPENVEDLELKPKESKKSVKK